MKTKTLKKNKVNVVTLGCSKNIVDSEVLMGQLRDNNIEVEHESKKDDASIVGQGIEPEKSNEGKVNCSRIEIK